MKNIKDMIETVGINTVFTNEDNPRILKDDKFKKLVKSVKEFPQMLQIRPIVVNSEMVVLGGNMRLQACKKAGLKDVTIIKADNLTEEQQKEFIIKDNVGFGEWDWDMINNEWDTEEVEQWGLDVPDFEDQEVLEAEEDEFDVPNGGIETDIVTGDLFEIGEHRLLCGDSTDSDAVGKLMNGEKADMVFTSPPYNGNTAVGFKQNKKGGMKTTNLYENNESDNKTSDEYLQFNNDIFKTIKTIASDDLVILYNINYNRNSPSEYIDIISNANDVFKLVDTIVWEKQMAISLQGDNLTRIYEFIFVLFNGDDKPKMNKGLTDCVKNLWNVSNLGANTNIHKACFPVKLVEIGVNLYAKEHGILFEPFTGSGTTMVAAHQLKRKCYGMELDTKYCQVIVDRMIKLDPTLEIKLNGKKYEPKTEQ